MWIPLPYANNYVKRSYKTCGWKAARWNRFKGGLPCRRKSRCLCVPCIRNAGVECRNHAGIKTFLYNNSYCTKTTSEENIPLKSKSRSAKLSFTIKRGANATRSIKGISNTRRSNEKKKFKHVAIDAKEPVLTTISKIESHVETIEPAPSERANKDKTAMIGRKNRTKRPSVPEYPTYYFFTSLPAAAKDVPTPEHDSTKNVVPPIRRTMPHTIGRQSEGYRFFSGMPNVQPQRCGGDNARKLPCDYFKRSKSSADAPDSYFYSNRQRGWYRQTDGCPRSPPNSHINPNIHGNPNVHLDLQVVKLTPQPRNPVKTRYRRSLSYCLGSERSKLDKMKGIRDRSTRSPCRQVVRPIKPVKLEESKEKTDKSDVSADILPYNQTRILPTNVGGSIYSPELKSEVYKLLANYKNPFSVLPTRPFTVADGRQPPVVILQIDPTAGGRLGSSFDAVQNPERDETSFQSNRNANDELEEIADTDKTRLSVQPEKIKAAYEQLKSKYTKQKSKFENVRSRFMDTGTKNVSPKRTPQIAKDRAPVATLKKNSKLRHDGAQTDFPVFLPEMYKLPDEYLNTFDYDAYARYSALEEARSKFHNYEMYDNPSYETYSNSDLSQYDMEELGEERGYLKTSNTLSCQTIRFGEYGDPRYFRPHEENMIHTPRYDRYAQQYFAEDLPPSRLPYSPQMHQNEELCIPTYAPFRHDDDIAVPTFRSQYTSFTPSYQRNILPNAYGQPDLFHNQLDPRMNIQPQFYSNPMQPVAAYPTFVVPEKLNFNFKHTESTQTSNLTNSVDVAVRSGNDSNEKTTASIGTTKSTLIGNPKEADKNNAPISKAVQNTAFNVQTKVTRAVSARKIRSKSVEYATKIKYQSTQSEEYAKPPKVDQPMQTESQNCNDTKISKCFGPDELTLIDTIKDDFRKGPDSKTTVTTAYMHMDLLAPRDPVLVSKTVAHKHHQHSFDKKKHKGQKSRKKSRSESPRSRVTDRKKLFDVKTHKISMPKTTSVKLKSTATIMKPKRQDSMKTTNLMYLEDVNENKRKQLMAPPPSKSIISRSTTIFNSPEAYYKYSMDGYVGPNQSAQTIVSGLVLETQLDSLLYPKLVIDETTSTGNFTKTSRTSTLQNDGKQVYMVYYESGTFARQTNMQETNPKNSSCLDSICEKSEPHTPKCKDEFIQIHISSDSLDARESDGNVEVMLRELKNVSTGCTSQKSLQTFGSRNAFARSPSSCKARGGNRDSNVIDTTEKCCSCSENSSNVTGSLLRSEPSNFASNSIKRDRECWSSEVSGCCDVKCCESCNQTDISFGSITKEPIVNERVRRGSKPQTNNACKHLDTDYFYIECCDSFNSTNSHEGIDVEVSTSTEELETKQETHEYKKCSYQRVLQLDISNYDYDLADQKTVQA